MASHRVPIIFTSMHLRPGSYRLIRFLMHWNTVALANDPGPNDVYTQASVFALNASVTGHIGYYYNGVSDVAD